VRSARQARIIVVWPVRFTASVASQAASKPSPSMPAGRLTRRCSRGCRRDRGRHAPPMTPATISGSVTSTPRRRRPPRR
jgi:hypothetical protein